jgi:hypothetical protein
MARRAGAFVFSREERLPVKRGGGGWGLHEAAPCSRFRAMNQLGVRERDPRTGRPVQDGHEIPLELLTDGELEEELVVAAAASGRLRLGRFEALERELARRQQRSTAA